MTNTIKGKYGKKIALCMPGRTFVYVETADKFLIYGSALPGDDLLGLQLVSGEGGTLELYAVSDKKRSLNSADLAWIFEEYAEVSSKPCTSVPFGGADRKIYALTARVEDPAEDISCVNRCYLSELLSVMASSGIRIQLIVGKAVKYSGRVLFSIPGELTARLSALISMTFVNSDIVPADEHPDDYLIPAFYMDSCMRSILDQYKRDSREDDPDDLEDLEDLELFEDVESPTESKTIPIEDMNFTVHTYNCLRRAGICDSGQLRKLTYSDLIKIRNLGKRGAGEVADKLKELGGENSLDTDSMDNAVDAARNYMQELEDLIGLDDIKEQVLKIAAYARMKKVMSDSGEHNLTMALNTCFMGNPGTAKTTVARILAGLFWDIGLLESPEVVEVGRADLVAGYVGHTAPLVKRVFESAQGKLLFIDEAYSLVDSKENSFGDEAITTIVQEMENHRDETIVIFAGYPDKMEDFFDRNPGLRSRVPLKIEFKDYPADVLAKIAELEAGKRNFTISPEARGKVLALCSEAASQPEFGNGRFCRNLIENAILSFAYRNFSLEDALTAPASFELRAEDFTMPPGIMKPKPAAKHYGFNVGEVPCEAPL